jgi:hypothetical protein
VATAFTAIDECLRVFTILTVDRTTLV